MTKNQEWVDICKEYCKQKGHELLFVNDEDFGYSNKEGNLHHVYANELYVMMGGKV